MWQSARCIRTVTPKCTQSVKMTAQPYGPTVMSHVLNDASDPKLAIWSAPFELMCVTISTCDAHGPDVRLVLPKQSKGSSGRRVSKRRMHFPRLARVRLPRANTADEALARLPDGQEAIARAGDDAAENQNRATPVRGGT